MKKRLIPTSFISMIMVFTMCGESIDKRTDWTSLDGNSFVFTVDRVLANVATVSLPSASLEDQDYKAIDDEMTYKIVFSQDGATVTITPADITGNKTDQSDQMIQYVLEEGTLAGGRFIIWKSNDAFQAEYTLYGSGLPIVGSERGSLDLVK